MNIRSYLIRSLSLISLVLVAFPTGLMNPNKAKQEATLPNTQGIGSHAISATSTIANVLPQPAAQDEPVPVFDYDDLPKTMVVELTFSGSDSASINSSEVILGFPPARIGNPPLLEIQVLDDAGNLVETFNAWDPRWVELNDFSGSHDSLLLPSATGQFFFPFASNLKAILVTNLPENRTYGPFDVRDGIGVFCEQNLNDVDCVSNLIVMKTASVDPVIAGETLEYTLTVINNGPNPAHSVRMVDILPSGVTYQSDDADCTEAPAGTLDCDLGILTSGETRVINITVIVDAARVYISGFPTSINNQASVSNQAGAEIAPGDNDASVGTLVVAAADLSILSFEAVDPPVEVLLGEELDITLRRVITNNGPSAPMDTDVTVTAAAPAGSSVSPPVSSFGELALGLGEQREMLETFRIGCGQLGLQAFTFTNEVQPAQPVDTDPDQSNNLASLSLNIECIDPIPPAITASADPSLLWPPNGKMVPVFVSGQMIDEHSGVDASSATYVVVDEYGLVQPSGSVVLQSDGSYSVTILLEASRLGGDQDGRHYTIIMEARDLAGNLGSASTEVIVPHDQGP